MIKKFKSIIFSKTGKNIITVYSADIVSTVIGAGIAILLIRNLSEFDYGLYTNFMAVLSLVTGIIASSINWITTRISTEYISVYKRIPSHIYGISLFFQTLFLFFLLIVIIPNSVKLSKLFFRSDLYSKAILLGVIASIGFILIEIARVIFQSSEKFKGYGILKIVKQLLLLVGIFFLQTTQKLNFLYVAFLWIIVLFILGIVLFFFLKRYISFSFGISEIKKFLKGIEGLIIYFLFLSLFNRLDVLMLSRFRSIEEVAVYGVAFKYYSLILLGLGSIHAVLLPKFSKVDYKNLEKQKDFVNRWIKLSSFVIIPIGILIMRATPLMNFLNGPKYAGSIFPFQLFCISIIISLMFSPIINILIAREDYSFLALLGFIAFSLNFIGNYFFIPLYGIVGATIVTIVSFGIINIFSYLKIKLFRN